MRWRRLVEWVRGLRSAESEFVDVDDVLRKRAIKHAEEQHYANAGSRILRRSQSVIKANQPRRS